jgi:hypothetical protein
MPAPRISIVVLALSGCTTQNLASTIDVPASANADGGARPFDTSLVCTSNQQWTHGDSGSPNMHPGRACITCHDTRDDAPSFRIAGTVYPTVHEPDDCNGASSTGGAKVVVTDANGTIVTLTPNAAGNFYDPSRASLVLPYHAKVVRNGLERSMSDAQTIGDCNSCHTVDGANGAPGRIVLP